jgi:MSHA biogenesis protein MshK
MAERLSAPLLLFAVLSACPAAHAQGALADPTRPPSIAPAAQAAGEASAPPGRLQSILISGTRKLAVIDGVTVPLGGKVDGATLVAIDETEVKLKRGEVIETLKLYPNIERQPVEAADNKKESR